MSIGWSSHNGSCLDLAMPALVAEIDQLKRSSAALQAQLTGLKSQVSLLLPPTPHEVAETEERDGYVHGEMYIPSASYAPPPLEHGQHVPPLTPDTSADWPTLPNITELTLDGKAGDRSSVISMTRGGAPLTKLPPRGHTRSRSRLAPVNISKANACVPGSDPTTPRATTPKARRAQRNSLQPPPRSAVTPRTPTFSMGTAVPPPRPPRRRPVNVPREIVEVATA
ncbi:hypothetical protein CcaverHIS002_0312490 [Cutaneotrichosporon cavernicola]|nr:hypothetical protein CcaverHIS002_0312490 [Cutaneotrichosporon cavernicola]